MFIYGKCFLSLYQIHLILFLAKGYAKKKIFMFTHTQQLTAKKATSWYNKCYLSLQFMRFVYFLLFKLIVTYVYQRQIQCRYSSSSSLDHFNNYKQMIFLCNCSVSAALALIHNIFFFFSNSELFFYMPNVLCVVYSVRLFSDRSFLPYRRSFVCKIITFCLSYRRVYDNGVYRQKYFVVYAMPLCNVLSIYSYIYIELAWNIIFTHPSKHMYHTWNIFICVCGVARRRRAVASNDTVEYSYKSYTRCWWEAGKSHWNDEHYYVPKSTFKYTYTYNIILKERHMRGVITKSNVFIVWYYGRGAREK